MSSKTYRIKHVWAGRYYNIIISVTFARYKIYGTRTRAVFGFLRMKY